MADTRSAIKPDWVSKTLAGALLGFTLAMLCSGIFAALTPGIVMAAKAQLAMWLTVPVWLGVFSLVYLFGSGLRAWLWLGGFNIVAFIILAAAR